MLCHPERSEGSGVVFLRVHRCTSVPMSRCGSPGGSRWFVFLLCSPMTPSDPAASTLRLLDVMTRLLGPDGCPWDRVQTHRTLIPYLLEEAYELVEAIERGDADAMREELGDVLLQVVFHARLAEQGGGFSFGDVADGLASKMMERHPHVFARETLTTPDQVSDAWDRRKLAERQQKTTDPNTVPSRLDGIPEAMPALMRAMKTGSRAAKAGFEWGNTDEIFAKAREELDEFEAARKRAAATPKDVEAREDAELEFGDLLFALVQLARWSGVDAERALRRSTDKFGQRFRHMERSLAAEGRDPAGIHGEAWWKLWAVAKAETA